MAKPEKPDIDLSTTAVPKEIREAWEKLYHRCPPLVERSLSAFLAAAGRRRLEELVEQIERYEALTQSQSGKGG